MLSAKIQLKEDTVAALQALDNVLQRDFVMAYAATGSPTKTYSGKSARVAGYKDRSADAQASRLLQRRKIQLAVMLVERDTRAELHAVTLVDAAWLHRHLSVLATSTILDYGQVTPSGDFRIDFNKIAARPELAAAIESVNIKRSADPIFADEITLKLMSRAKMIELVGRHVAVQAWKDNVEVTGNIDSAERIERTKKRLTG